MERASKRIAIIGSGISGLVAAYELNKYIRKEKLPFEFLLLEGRLTPGGLIKTIETDDGYIDVGASSFDLRKSDIRPFLEEIGLLDDVQYSIGGKMDRFSGHEFIYTDKPTYHGIPLQLKDIIHDKELSLSDKFAVIVNSSFNNMRRGSDLCITTDQFLEYRFCKEVSSLIAYPNYPENIYGSLELCPPVFFDPQLVELFEYSDSRIKMEPETLEFYMDGSGKEYTLKNGMASLVNRLLQDVQSYVQTGKMLTEIKQINQGIHLLKLNKKEELRVGSIISTIPLSESFQLFNDISNEKGLIPKPIMSGMGTILFQFPKGVINRFPHGYGFVVPKRSSYHISKATFLNRKWPSFADSEFDNLVVDIGRRQEDTIIELPDEAILDFIEKELQEILELNGTYHYARVYRWHNAIPHLSLEDRKELMNNEELERDFESKGIFLGGNGFHGYGMKNAVKEGMKLAKLAIEYMKEKNRIDV